MRRRADAAFRSGAAAGATRYLTRLCPVKIGRIELELFELTEDDPIVAQAVARGLDGEKDLPFWTKLWPAALLLARFVAGLAPKPGALMLELGAGLGLVGLAAAAHGHRVIVSDIDVRALELAQASARHNGLDGVSFTAFDWERPCLDRPFEMIVAAEVLYQPPQYPILAGFLRTHLAPGGHLYLAHTERPFTIGFFDLIREDFRIRGKRFNLRDGDGNAEAIILYDITARDGA
jgi:2-polyprenyl-3-methyl-5-hydroxy-6-metoxy-1,4-benzoquinol methylase